jgi:hypothetical protein
VTEYVVVECFVELKHQENKRSKKQWPKSLHHTHPPTHPPTSGSLNSPVFSIFCVRTSHSSLLIAESPERQSCAPPNQCSDVAVVRGLARSQRERVESQAALSGVTHRLRSRVQHQPPAAVPHVWSAVHAKSIAPARTFTRHPPLGRRPRHARDGKHP